MADKIERIVQREFKDIIRDMRRVPFEQSRELEVYRGTDDNDRENGWAIQDKLKLMLASAGFSSRTNYRYNSPHGGDGSQYRHFYYLIVTRINQNAA